MIAVSRSEIVGTRPSMTQGNRCRSRQLITISMICLKTSGCSWRRRGAMDATSAKTLTSSSEIGGPERYRNTSMESASISVMWTDASVKSVKSLVESRMARTFSRYVSDALVYCSAGSCRRSSRKMPIARVRSASSSSLFHWGGEIANRVPPSEGAVQGP